ncbi:hypothetical protein ONZ51_g10053 [Trametes cubensis]|uniref:Hydrophobin n=1 Tax=Trametes cubensis TaxID=1111947 RepID=A0AAD7X746_9APHY|nr:hypothetical protein ONZ51_g10053 [Trametes cubensis]
MSFRRLVAFTALALPLLAVTMPLSLEADLICSTGTIQCCNSVIESNSNSAKTLLGLLGVVVPGNLTGLIGIYCSPISILAASSANPCDANTLCCTDNNIGGLLSTGCVRVES